MSEVQLQIGRSRPDSASVWTSGVVLFLYGAYLIVRFAFTDAEVDWESTLILGAAISFWIVWGFTDVIRHIPLVFLAFRTEGQSLFVENRRWPKWLRRWHRVAAVTEENRSYVFHMDNAWTCVYIPVAYASMDVLRLISKFTNDDLGLRTEQESPAPPLDAESRD